jgi:carboxyl-terminal processing protease
MKTNRQIACFLFLCFILVVTASSGFGQQPAAVSSQTVEQSPEAKRRETFELVWQTVNKNFYDPNFGGVDWKAVHDRYAPQATSARSDPELYSVLQLMVNELHKSHFWIIPPEAIPKLRPKSRPLRRQNEAAEENNELPDEQLEAETPLDLIKEDLADRLSTGIGIELRVIDGSVVVTRVEPASPAARAGLRPGFVIRSINGKSLSEAVFELEHSPLVRDMIRPILPLVLVANYLNGNIDDAVNVSYTDARNLPRRALIRRAKLNGEMSPALGNLPSFYTEFEAKRLRGGIGYVRFNAFVPLLMKKVCAALREMHDAPGMIIDLRGNQGGVLGMISGLGGLLQDYTSVFGTMKMRANETPILVFPQRSPYTGALVIMVDGSTQSAAEIFAAGMQKSDRAVVVGETSAGSTLPSSILKLPTGALFQYAIGNYETVEGIFLEGRGVIPDAIVKLNRRSLLRRGDPQLAIAMAKMRERISPPRPKELIADVTVADASANKSSVPPVKVAVDPPPPAKQTTETIPVEIAKAEDENARIAKETIDRYIEAIGGEKALLKVTNRVSTGSIDLPTGLSGTIEVYEAAPNRSSVFMNLKGFGVLQQTFDGKVRWLHDPVRGYVKMSEGGGGGNTFQHELSLRNQLATLRFEHREKIGDQECVVLARSIMGRVLERLYFAAETGLLLREGELYFEDYREVDGVKIPFVTRQDGNRSMTTTIRLTNVRQNVTIDESKFAERADCFTRPEQNWTDK